MAAKGADATRSSSATHPDFDRRILIERTLHAPRALVWQAWTDPKQIIRWWGPNGFSTTVEVMDVRPGGVWQYVMHGPDGTDYPNRSVFREVIAPERIIFTHGGGAADRPRAQFESTWTFTALGEDTTRVLIDMVFPTAAERDAIARHYGAIEGGHQTLARLADLLEPRGPRS
ncbi:MAG: SRPBCC family protein [Steroidobacteraceae bacterium]